MNSTAQPIVAIIGAGEMGAAVGRRLMIRGARVVTSLQGRSRDSAARVSRAGLEVIDDDAELVRDADFVLSIVPPAAALEVAERLQPALARSRSRPIFADCNAIAPATAVRAGERLAGCRYVDAGIIGGPPPEQIDSPGPRFYASGPFAREFAALGGFGLDIAVLDGPIGAASALKLSYAGLTKGIIALGSAMVGAAARAGLADALSAELARTQPQILARLARGIPAMFPKAHRWVAEMEEIAAFIGGGDRGADTYRGIARIYERIARERSDRDAPGDIQALLDFCARAATSAREK